MALWVLSFCIMAIEAWGSVYFFDTFLKKTDVGRLGKCRYVVLYFADMVVALLGGYFDLMGIKVMLVILVSITFCTVFYEAGWKQRIFFSGLNYALLFLTDLFFLQIENMSISQNVVLAFLLLPSKMIWLCLVFIVRKIWKGKNKNGELSHKEWLKFSMIPLLTVASMLLMFFCSSTETKVQTAYLFLSAGLIFINILVIELMQGILEKEELFRESALAGQKKESQLAHYRDMQAVYERQGRKMHDYKNQIRTMQVLLKKGDMQAATALAEQLTESISVEMAAVSTNHPVVDAVLNQKFHAAREQGVSMTFRVGDMGGLRLNEEETVILLSNLLDNAIHECVKVARRGRNVVIHVKLVQEGGKLIFSVRNPVVEKVQVMEGTGLSNVKAVADKYGGDFAVSCDEEKFQAVVML